MSKQLRSALVEAYGRGYNDGAISKCPDSHFEEIRDILDAHKQSISDAFLLEEIEELKKAMGTEHLEARVRDFVNLIRDVIGDGK